jgi:hypothetical protein
MKLRLKTHEVDILGLVHRVGYGEMREREDASIETCKPNEAF